jgi:hypothetical protein
MSRMTDADFFLFFMGIPPFICRQINRYKWQKCVFRVPIPRYLNEKRQTFATHEISNMI